MIVSISQTLLVLVISCLAGYGFARIEFPGRGVVFVLVLLGLAIPQHAIIVPLHKFFNDFQMHNTYQALILPGLAGPFGVFLMTAYFRAIPIEIEEAARLDNASRFKIFWRISVPLAVPAMATLAIFTFLHSWNDYLWPLISATKPEMYTLTVGLAATQTNIEQSEGLGYLMAQSVFAGLPMLILYIFSRSTSFGRLPVRRSNDPGFGRSQTLRQRSATDPREVTMKRLKAFAAAGRSAASGSPVTRRPTNTASATT